MSTDSAGSPARTSWASSRWTRPGDPAGSSVASGSAVPWPGGVKVAARRWNPPWAVAVAAYGSRRSPIAIRGPAERSGRASAASASRLRPAGSISG